MIQLIPIPKDKEQPLTIWGVWSAFFFNIQWTWPAQRHDGRVRVNSDISFSCKFLPLLDQYTLLFLTRSLTLLQMSDHAKNVGETVILKTCNINHSSPLQKNIFENCKRCRHTRAQKKGTRFVGSSFMYIHLSAAFLEQELKTYILFPPLPHSWSSKIHIFTNSGHESNDLSIWNQPVQPLRRQWGHIHTLLKYLPEKVC